MTQNGDLDLYSINRGYIEYQEQELHMERFSYDNTHVRFVFLWMEYQKGV